MLLQRVVERLLPDEPRSTGRRRNDGVAGTAAASVAPPGGGGSGQTGGQLTGQPLRGRVRGHKRTLKLKDNIKKL